MKVGDRVRYIGPANTLHGQVWTIKSKVDGINGGRFYTVNEHSGMFVEQVLTLAQDDPETATQVGQPICEQVKRPEPVCNCDVISNHPDFDHMHTVRCPRYTKQEAYV